MGRSRSRSHSASRSRSRSRSRGRRSRSRSRSRSRERDGYRVHVADLGIDCSKRELEKAFEKFGPLREVWLARNPPCFAFIVFRHKEDAEEAVREINGSNLCGGRVRVSMALPRARGRHRRGFDPNLRCYQCGERGHFSRDCNEIWRSRRRSRSKSRDRYRRRSYRSRSRDRKRDRSRDRRRRSRSRDRRSRSRDRRSRSRDRRGRSRSGSRSAERKSRSRSKSLDQRSRSPSAPKEASPAMRSRSGSEGGREEQGPRSEEVSPGRTSDKEESETHKNGSDRNGFSGEADEDQEKKGRNFSNGYDDIDLEDILAVNLANDSEGSSP